MERVARGYMLAAIAGLSVLAIGFGLFLLSDSNVAVLNPKGWVAEQQRNLILVATGLMLIVVLPVFVLTGYIVWQFREGNKKAKYNPDWDHSRSLEILWWAVPFVIIAILSVITWNSSHQLDPFRPLASTKEPLKVQVVALQWRWLFIYPEQGLATINQLYIPTDRPILFEITADAPMNSFWIPNLGGQIYAMPAMATKLHLIADEPGVYFGQSANISGEGFAKMKFDTYAIDEKDFNNWVNNHPQLALLNMDSYSRIAKPSEDSDPQILKLESPDLFARVIQKYMNSVHKSNNTKSVGNGSYHD